MLVELGVLLLMVARDGIGGDSNWRTVLDLVVLGRFGSGLGWRRLGSGGDDNRAGRPLLILDSKPLPDVVVELHGALVGGLERLELDAAERFVLGAEMLDEVVEQLFGHLDVLARRGLGLDQPA